MPRNLTSTDLPLQKDTGSKSKAMEILKDKLNVSYKGIQTRIDKNTKKRIDQVARKTIIKATKVKDPRTFEQKYKTIDGKILTYTPHTAWVQTFGKHPRLLRNSGAAFVPNPLIYGPCRPSGLSDYVAYKPARRSGPCLRFLDIENPTASLHPMFRQDETTGLPRKLTQKEKVSGKAKTDSPTKQKASATGKRTGGRPTQKLQTSGMRLQTDILAKTSNNDSIIQQPVESDNDDQDNDDKSSVSSEDIAPSPKRQHKKRTPPPPPAISTEPLRKSTRNRHSALSTAFGNPVPINAINTKHDEKRKTPQQFEIDSPPDKENTDN